MSDSTAVTAKELAPPASAARRAATGVLSMLGGMAVGGGGAFLVLNFAPTLGESTVEALAAQFGPWTAPLVVVLSIVMIFAIIGVHEAGHVAAGVAAGMRFTLFAAGPLRIDRDPGGGGRVTVRFNRNLAFWGGIAGCVPTDGDRVRERLAVLLAGGPGASILFAAIAGALTLTVPMAPLLTFAVGLSAVMSAGIGLVTLIPMRTGGFMSDGGRLLRLLRGGPAAERDAVSLALIARATSNEPPRDWPRGLVDEVVRLRDDSFEESMAWTLAYYHHLDAGERDAAARALARAMALLDRWPEPLRPAMHAEAAYFAAISGRPAEARAHLDAIPAVTANLKQYDRDRARAALALAEGDREQATAIASGALAALPENNAFAEARLRELLRDAQG